MDLGILLYTWWNGQLVGKDEFGNRYYQAKRIKKFRPPKRWIIYKGRPEASKVPACWHGWLHYTVDEPPHQMALHYSWQKKHLPNLTGTPLAYHPGKNSSLYPRAAKRKAPLGYEPWKP